MWNRQITLTRATGGAHVPRILVVEDDLVLRQAIHDVLREEHYTVTLCGDGDVGLHEATHGSYDLLVLDVMLPGIDGFTVAKTLRNRKVWLPILMLTAKDHVEDRVRGLESGADDYLVKPFASTELIARIRAQLRRVSPEFQDPAILELGNLTFHPSTRETVIGDERITLTPKEAILIELFLRYPGMVLTRQQLIDRLWGYDSDVLENTLEAHISKLRRRLMAAGGPDIQVVRGLGYRLEREP